MKKTVIIIILIIILGAFWMNRVKIKYLAQDMIREPVPEAKTSSDFDYSSNGGNVLSTTLTMTREDDGLPYEFNLDVPFTSQAPHKEWDDTYKEACEEASVIMVDYFYKDKSFSGPDEADEEILNFIKFEKEMLGFFESTSVNELARVVESYWGYDVDLIYDFSVENIKQAVYRGYPVVLPAAGQILDNPNFQDPGPIYHMLVIKGWRGDEFITNDPGTMHGEDWLYEFNHLVDSAHDWNGGEVENGDKVIMIIRP